MPEGMPSNVPNPGSTPSGSSNPMGADSVNSTSTSTETSVGADNTSQLNPEVNGPEASPGGAGAGYNKDTISDFTQQSDGNRANGQTPAMSPEAAQASKAQRDDKANAAAVKAVGETALNAYTGGAYGAVKNIPIAGGMIDDKVNQIADKGGKIVSKINRTMPGGDKAQAALTGAHQSGLTDAAGKAGMAATGGASGASGGASGGLPGGMPGGTPGDTGLGGTSPGGEASAPEAPGIDIPDGYELENQEQQMPLPEPPKDDGPEEGLGEMPKAQILVAIAPYIGGLFGFLLIISFISFAFSPHAGAVLDLTNAGANASTPETTSLTNYQAEQLLIYIGDSRINGMSMSLKNNNSTFIAEDGANYNWLVSTGKSQLDGYLNGSEMRIVVLAMGINDLYNVDNYIAFFNNLVSSYPNAYFYFLGVGPVNETKAIENGYTVTNAEINQFNAKLANALGDKYLTPGSADQFNSIDGIHYDSQTAIDLNERIIVAIRNLHPSITNNITEAASPIQGNEVGSTSIGTSATYPTLSSDRCKFGKFPYNDNSSGRNINIDPAWVSANIMKINFPCSQFNESVQIHRAAKANFDAALTNICKLVTTGINGMKLQVADIKFGGAYVPRKTNGGTYSLHAYGIATDFNYNWSTKVNGTTYKPYASQGTDTYNEYQKFINALGGNEADSRNVNYILWKYAFEPAGFKWGGHWGTSSFDPMHFEINWRSTC